MKSIRLSLLLYFLALLGLALGGVSTLVYRTTAQTLLEKQASTIDLVNSQYDDQCQEVRSALDQRIHRQAMLLATKARWTPIYYETHLRAMAVGLAALPGARLGAAYFAADHGVIRGRLLAARPFDVIVPDAEDYLPHFTDHPEEFFQISRPRSGLPWQWSASLGENRFSLDETLRDRLEPLQEHFDEVELDGIQLRRVTLKSHVVGSRAGFMSFFPFPAKKSYNGRGSSPRSGPGGGAPPRAVDQTQPQFFIQYASDTTALEARIDEFAQQRDQRIEALGQETRDALTHLARRLGLIALVTFVGILSGGFVLVRLGLAPLARLSDAVSQVNEKDFRLKVDAARLPTELRPIAGRLEHTLDQLRGAFAREKQAAADISHELRTPLAALMTTVEVALRKQRSPAEYRDILEECQLSGRHMAHLVEQLLALARLDAGAVRLHTELVDVAELARQAVDMVRPLAQERGLTLQADAAGPILTECDPTKLREIVLNLLHNAVEYNRPEGSIALAVNTHAGGIELLVRDTGIGIAPEARQRIFERFYRADPSRHADSPHCGLGLAIVKSYVDLMGGAIAVDSGAEGTTFRVRIPMTAAPPAPTRTAAVA